MTEDQEREIARLLGNVREEVNELDTLARQAAQAAQSLTSSLGDCTSISMLGGVLKTMDSQFHEFKVAVADKVAELTGAWNRAIEDNKSDISEAIEAAAMVVGDIKTGLSDVFEGIGQSEEFVNNLDQQRGTAFNAAEQTVEAAFGAAEEITGALDRAVVDRFEAISEQISALAMEIDETLENGIDEIDEQLERPIKALSEAIDQAIAEFRQFLAVSVKDALLEQVEQEFMEPAKEKIARLIKTLEDEILRLSEAAIEGSEQSAEKREELKTAVDLLRSAIDPALDALGGLRSLAGTVGISI